MKPSRINAVSQTRVLLVRSRHQWRLRIENRGCGLTMRKFFAFVICILAFAIPHVLHACAVCTELPETTISDQILAAEIVVLAGPSQENPFEYSTRRIFKGNNEELRNAPNIPFLIDSVTRRAFRADPTATVLLTYGPEINDKTGRDFSRAWRRIFVMNSDRSEFLEKLQSNSELWHLGETDNTARVLFFSDYLWHRDQALHDLAMVEIGRSDYAPSRPIGGRVSTSQILDELNNLNRFVYWPVAIRLLGLQNDPQARSIVRSRFAKALKSGGLHLHEWARAGIEADGVYAINEIGLALKGPRKTLDDRKALVRALSDAGSSQTQFQDEIVKVFADVLDGDPELTLQVAVATRNWGKTALHKKFEALVAMEETDPATLFFLNIVLQKNTISE